MAELRAFFQVLRGEWTKLWSVRSTAFSLLAAVALTVLLSLLSTSGSSVESDGAPSFIDEFHFVHRPLTGDGTLTARVADQRHSNEWAKAGLMIKGAAEHGSPYAAVMVTPEHGVRFEAMFNTDVGTRRGTAPRWLRLTRTGNSIAAASSTDGSTWDPLGTVDVAALPRTAEVGLFVTSPPNLVVQDNTNGTSTTNVPSTGTATFGNVSVTGPAAPWTDDDVVMPGTTPPRGGSTGSGDTFTVTGSGDIVGFGMAGWFSLAADDVVVTSLSGVQLGLLAMIALGVLFVTSEYRTGTIRTTLAASPRRGRVLAAKAVVLGGTTFLAGLVAGVASFLVSQPTLRANGYRPPLAPDLSLFDGPVLRAVVGTALFLAVLTLFSLGVGVIRRRAVGAIVIVVALVVVPQIVGPTLSFNAEMWLNRLTPVAGLAIQRTQTARFDVPIGPWAGFGVLCAYAAVALFLAFWGLRRRDA